MSAFMRVKTFFLTLCWTSIIPTYSVSGYNIIWQLEKSKHAFYQSNTCHVIKTNLYKDQQSKTLFSFWQISIFWLQIVVIVLEIIQNIWHSHCEVRFMSAEILKGNTINGSTYHWNDAHSFLGSFNFVLNKSSLLLLFFLPWKLRVVLQMRNLGNFI